MEVVAVSEYRAMERRYNNANERIAEQATALRRVEGHVKRARRKGDSRRKQVKRAQVQRKQLAAQVKAMKRARGPASLHAMRTSTRPRSHMTMEAKYLTLQGVVVGGVPCQRWAALMESLGRNFRVLGVLGF
jgi:pyridoxal biosynthesis lyase PdxS